MIVLVIGGAGSGKSAIAENIAVKISQKGKLYYIATMKNCDSETDLKIKKHIEQRSGKGFTTIEKPFNICDLKTENSTLLIECMGNLLANEMFGQSVKNCSEKITSDIFKLDGKGNNIIIVSNDIEPERNQDIYTLNYIRELAQINRKLAETAAIVIESVCGIPVFLKGEKLYNEICI